MGSEVAVMNGTAVAVMGSQFSDEQLDLLKRTICQGASNDEFELFIGQCKRTRLDPFAKQIHAVKRFDKKAGRDVMSIQTGIDGYRLIAERTGQYEGQTPAMWCGEDGVWKDVWLSKDAPAAAKVGVHKRGFKEPVYAVALWTEYVQQYPKDGKWFTSPMWQKMGALMLSKCAEALALRKAFPQELSGIYTNEEMAQADRQEPAEAAPAPAVTDEEIKGWRKWRASANKSLQNAKTLEDLESKRNGLESITKLGPDLWGKRTYHNDFETFGDLFAVHKARVERDLELAGPEGIRIWIKGVMETPSIPGLASFVKSYRENERFQNFECEAALNDRALQLGLSSYTDVEEQDDEASKDSNTYQG